MAPIKLDGKMLADQICLGLKDRVDRLKEKEIYPQLAIIINPDDPAGRTYVRNKIRRCEEIGIIPVVVDSTKIIGQYGGITSMPFILQSPAIYGFDQKELEHHYRVTPELDVDGAIHEENIANLAMGKPAANSPCTPMGIMRLLHHYSVPIRNMRVTVIGRSNIVGRPIARMLEHEGATVTLCHSQSTATTIMSSVLNSDIVVSATGVRGIVSPELYGNSMYKLNNTVLIDVGMNRDENGKLCGDIDAELYQHSLAYTPVPGGIGPMTVAMLMENTVRYYEGVIPCNR